MDLEMRVSSHVEQIDSSARMEAMLRKIEVRWAGARNEETERLEREQMGKCANWCQVSSRLTFSQSVAYSNSGYG